MIAVGNLNAFWNLHAAAQRPLRNWLAAVQSAKWNAPTDITAQFSIDADTVEMP